MRDCFKFLTVMFAIASSQGSFADATSTEQPRRVITPVEHWQTYSQSGFNGTHTFIENKHSFTIKKLSAPSKHFKTGYAFINNGALYFEDRGNNVSYKRNWLGIYNTSHIPSNNIYTAGDYTFSFDTQYGQIFACQTSTASECKTFDFQPDSYPYVYAQKEGSVLAITNFGEALLFKDGNWCRMSMHNDIYECTDPAASLLTAPRAIQFYSSIRYQGKVLLGEWPTGRLYEFDGSVLKPSNMSPPKIAELADQRLGYEAQTMASYCGDLFVGYWPKGEVWRYDHVAKDWKFFKRFFSGEENEPFIPYSYRPDDELHPAFFGQRITAMVPYGDAMYVTTSNLRAWTTTDTALAKIDPSKVAEYGSIYKVTKPGCTTSYAANLH